MTTTGTTATPGGRPGFEVRVGGTALAPPVARDILEIEVHEEVNRHGRCILLLHNWDPDRRAVRHSDDGPFTAGADLAVALGHGSATTGVFDGVIASVTAHFPAGSPPMLRIDGRSRSILLEHPARSRQLADVTDADLAAAVAADYGLRTDAAAGSRHRFWASDRTSDWQALRQRAAALGWVAYVRGTTLVMRPPAPNEDPLELEWTRNIIELHLTEDLTAAIDTATGAGWDVDAAEPIEAERSGGGSGLDTGRRAGQAAAVRDAGWPLRAARTESGTIGAADEADARAVAAHRAAELGYVHGTGVVAGDPGLRCDGWLAIAGVGSRLAGPHYLTAARHRLSPAGYTTEFQVGSPPALAPPPAPAAAAPGAAAGGLALGVVAGLDDREGLNRIRVRLPWREDGGEGIWARQSSLDAGDGYGAVVVPSMGQEVLVGFIDADPAHPVVLGALYNGAAKPPVAVDPDTNAVRTLVTPDGHTLSLVDGDDGGLTLSTAAGQQVVLSEADSSLTLTHGESGNAIRISADGIELTAQQGDLVLKAPKGSLTVDATKLAAKTTGPSTLESSATLKLKAAGSLAAQGTPITLN
ncbi:phage baseplate assembly protein V [Arthrobacter sp. JSM 101049]|uniref:phage baseplate assembly protein V n=1 Tax=Arthrobacter sp. JSM 101049 TaxID=929097 RepID=UPI0035672065